MEVFGELHAPTALSPDNRDSWYALNGTSDGHRTSPDVLEKPRFLGHPTRSLFTTSTEVSFFLNLVFFYLFIVGIVGYCCIWIKLYDTHDTHKKQTGMGPAGLEPTIPASERPQTLVLDRAAIGLGYRDISSPSSERPR